MRKVAFNAILRLPDYWSDGFIIVDDSKNIKGLFTVDSVEGIFLKNGKMILNFTKYCIHLKKFISSFENMQFLINVGELCSPSEYFFSFENYTDCSLELISVIKNHQEIKELENLLAPFFPTI